MDKKHQPINWNERLLKAAITGRQDDAKNAIAQGADINYQSEYGYSALICACLSGKAELAKWLLLQGADENLTTQDGKTALMIAEEEGHTEFIQFMDFCRARKENTKLAKLIQPSDNASLEQGLNF